MLNCPPRYQPTGNSDSGGFGSVIFCKDTHLDRDVAIKFIKDASEKHRLIDEYKALMQLRSKHVVQIFDIVPSENDTFGIVQEYIDGEDLWKSSFAQSSLENYLKTLWQLASGIADIHEAGVIHRDIKPNNMKLDSEGIIKIFDFGLSRNEGKAAETVGFKGTLCFAAPELLNYGHVSFTKAIDTYAFGVTAIVLSGATLPSALKNIPPHSIAIDFFSNLPITLPVELATLLTACLSYNPDARPSMADVRDRLLSYILHNKHQALAVHNNQPHILNAEKRTVDLKLLGIGEIKIEYDGIRFFVAIVDGEVFINNQAVTAGNEIPGSCVVALGAPYRQNARKYITFDVSNPEVVL